ncbi:CPBP family intramembrane glutamic endopeptidase [Halobaculum sp. D14]|uniref:CPBP family intramembrane glutamic endopeptidase n=1 Tax=Halobaculum sp. D14 TaxID=3421642 RepID=UPI003EC0A18D
MTDDSDAADAGGVEPGAVAIRLGQAVLAVFAAFVAAAALVPIAADVGRFLGATQGSPALAVAETIGQTVGFAAAAVLFLVYAGDRELLRIRWPTRRESGFVVGGAVVLLVAQYALLLALSAVGVDVAQNRALSPGADAPVYFLYMVVVSVLFVGPAEELLFRGVAQGELRRALPAPAAVAVAGFLFGSIHFFAGTGTATQQAAYVLVATLLGCVLGSLYEDTGNLVVPALAHGAYNGVLFLIQYLAA